jgi:hypothetical protein
MVGAELRIEMSRAYPIDGDHPLVPALQASLDAARDFGLSDTELWSAVRRALSGADTDEDLSECVDRLHGELAMAILASQRRSSPSFG